MQTEDKISHLAVITFCLFASFVFSIIAVASNGWSTAVSTSLLEYYNANKTAKEPMLWIVGIVVLVILGIICLAISAIILLARFFNHGKGRAVLAGVLSVFAGAVFIVALGIYMGQHRPAFVMYGYSFALLWCAVAPAVVAGIVFFLLKDSGFLTSELRYSSAAQTK